MPVKKGGGKSKKGGKKKGSGGSKKKGGGKKGGKGKKGKGKASTDVKSLPPPDPLSAAAMLNAYYISHGAVEFLTFRGYSRSGATGKKKKKGKKR